MNLAADSSFVFKKPAFITQMSPPDKAICVTFAV